MKMSVGTLCLALQFSVVTAQMSWTASLLQTIDDLLGSGTKNGDVSTEETVEAVDVLWGVTDREATVGKLFKMTIPNNAFSGNVQSYMVTQPGRTALPRWIYHNTTTNVLYGVPSMVDLGNVLLEVTAYGPEHTTSNKSKNKLTPHASTSFVISVHPDTLKHPTWHNHLTADSNEDLDETFFSQQEGMCNWNENIVRASLVLDASMEELKPESRVMLLYKAANFLQKSVQAFRLTEKHSRVITRLMDTSVLLAGPGNADIRTTNVGIELSWIISCGDSSNVDDISKILSHTIQTGRISRELGYDIISWHLTETMPPENIRRIRKKRQAQLHTPINTPTLYPTATSTTRSSTSASTSSSTSTSTMSLTGTLTSSLASTSASTSASESIHMSSTIQITSSEVTIEPSVTLTSLPLTSTSLPSLMPSTFLSSIESTLVTSSMISLAVTSEPGTFSPTPVLTTTTLLETVAALELSSVSGSSSEFMTETSPSGFLMPESSSVASLSLSPLSSTEPSLTSSVFFLQTSSNPSQSVAMVTSSVNSEETTLVPPGSVSSSLEVSGIQSAISMTPFLPSPTQHSVPTEVAATLTSLTRVQPSETIMPIASESMTSFVTVATTGMASSSLAISPSPTTAVIPQNTAALTQSPTNVTWMTTTTVLPFNTTVETNFTPAANVTTSFPNSTAFSSTVTTVFNNTTTISNNFTVVSNITTGMPSNDTTAVFTTPITGNVTSVSNITTHMPVYTTALFNASTSLDYSNTSVTAVPTEMNNLTSVLNITTAPYNFTVLSGLTTVASVHTTAVPATTTASNITGLSSLTMAVTELTTAVPTSTATFQGNTTLLSGSVTITNYTTSPFGEHENGVTITSYVNLTTHTEQTTTVPASSLATGKMSATSNIMTVSAESTSSEIPMELSNTTTSSPSISTVLGLSSSMLAEHNGTAYTSAGFTKITAPSTVSEKTTSVSMPVVSTEAHTTYLPYSTSSTVSTVNATMPTTAAISIFTPVPITSTKGAITTGSSWPAVTTTTSAGFTTAVVNTATTTAPQTTTAVVMTSVPTTTPETAEAPTTAAITITPPTTVSTATVPVTTTSTTTVPTTEAPTTAAVTGTPPAAVSTTTIPATTGPTTATITSAPPTTVSATTTITTGPTTAAITSTSPTTVPATTTSITTGPTTAVPTTAAITSTSPTTVSATTTITTGPTTAAITSTSPTTVPATTTSITTGPTTAVPTTAAITSTSPTTVPATTTSITTGPTTAVPTTAAITSTPSTTVSTATVPVTTTSTTTGPPTAAPTTKAPTTAASMTAPQLTVVSTSASATAAFRTPVHTAASSSTAVPSTAKFLSTESNSNTLINKLTTSMFVTSSSMIGMTSAHQLVNRDITTAANHPPQLVNPMKKIAVHLGTFFKVDVPYDTFYDFEDGNTRSLKLSLRTTGGDYIGPGSFIQLNSERQVLYGLALEQHVTDGTVVLELVAEDQYGETAVDNIEVIINSANVQDVSFVIKTTFDLDYASFTSRIVNVITLMYRISAFYGDESPMFYTVISISNGSVIVEWTDNRISRASCQNDAISHVYGTIYSEGKINPAFKEMLLPEFPLKYLTYKLVGACLRTEVTPTDMISTEAIVAAATGRSIALLIILPMIIILIVIMVIFLIYWFCLRNRQKHTDYLTDQERQIYANNRKPVLLESELEMNDVQQKPRKPLILNEEAPSKAFDNPGYIDLDEGRPLPPPYALPQEEPMAAIYGPVQATSTPKAPYNEDTLSDRPPPPPYRVPPIYLGTPGSSNI